ncbi:PREDICTED: nuclear pore complex protein Nup85 [Nicrophorus vespilloides]|uniref:Nuclear pore complex protein Nup85 n=1 Tax=Nicrophorus vespilloides TaxID=110193 RepID=A0ABM1MJ37_NICVS|nr:PREDICTED: nuclear pore complex protein Nup85 [Nicrophorus vespilloides]
MEDENLKTFLIPNDLCKSAGIAGTWMSGNKIGVFPYHNINHSSKDAPSQYTKNVPSSVFHVKHEVVLFHPILRRLVTESMGIFLNLQTVVENKPSDYKQHLQQFSVQYRSVIRASLENLRDEVLRATGEERETLQNFITIFYSVECIWHLCEILYIENIPGHVVIKHLLEWVRFHFPKYERKAAFLLSGESIGSLESRQDYWETVIGCLLQGRVEVVRALLSCHSAANSTHFKLADQILKSMPTYGVYEGVSVQEFNLRWKHWLVDTQSKIDSKLFISEKNLHLMMRLIVGEEMAWSEVQSQCEAWYELLAAWLFYTEPTVKSFELGAFAKRCISRMGTRMHHLDRVLLAAMEGDVQIIKEIQHMTENGWFVTHLMDLLYHCEQLEKWQTDKEDSLKLRHSFVFEYGNTLAGHKSLWQLGLNYLDHCFPDGLAAIELLLPRVPINDESKAHRVIQEAQKRGLSHIAHSVAKIEGLKSLRNDRMGNALVWALRSQDSNFASFLADKFLKKYVDTGILPNVDLLSYLGSCMMASDRLIFLGKYYQFNKLHKDKSYREAAKALVSLIASKFTPKFFWSTLLSEALTLLECDELLLSSNDVFNLLNAVEERLDCLCELDELEPLIRLGIARNLSRALTYEAQYT